MDDDVVLERRERLLIVTLNRPSVRNAVDRATSEAVAAAMDVLDSDATLAVGILTGAGGTFCAGMDLKAFLRGERPEARGRGFGGLTEAPPHKPLVAAVEGWALAGGLELALACDLVVAATDARFGLPEVSRGLIAGSGGLLRLPERIPRQIAMEYALTGDPMTAADAHRWGLVNRLTEPGCALREAVILARRIAANAPLAVRTTKWMIEEGPRWAREERWGRQRAALEEVLSSDDAREGAAAFAERRAPRWQQATQPGPR
jgi:enoyl-CoA hydratase